MAEFAKMCHEYYELKRRPITTSNPRSNSIIELIHQAIRNIICTFNVKKINRYDPWSGILATTMFGVRATYHTTLRSSTIQFVFGNNMNLNVKRITNWEISSSKNKRVLTKITCAKIAAA